jgi:hypothetical protein
MEVYKDVLYSGMLNSYIHRLIINQKGSADRTICAWDPVSEKCVTTWSSEQTSLVRCLKIFKGVLYSGKFPFNISPTLNSGSIDHTIRGWDTTSGKCIITLNGHTNWIRCMEVLQGILYSGSDDRTIRGWDTAHGRCTSIMTGHTSLVLCLLAFNTSLFSGSRDKTIRCWDTSTGLCSFILEGHTADVNCLCTFNDVLFSGSDDRTIRCWNVDNKSCLWVLNGHTNAVNCLQVYNTILFSGSADKTIRGFVAVIFLVSYHSFSWKAIPEEILLSMAQQHNNKYMPVVVPQSEIAKLHEELRLKDEKLKKVKQEKKTIKKELKRIKQGRDRRSKELQKLEVDLQSRSTKHDEEFVQNKRELDKYKSNWKLLAGKPITNN